MIKANFKERWVEALRSGEYKQGSHALRIKFESGDRFCCLGVACDLLEPEAWRYRHGDYFHKKQESSLSDRIRRMIGLKEDEVCTLIELNDGKWVNMSERQEPKSFIEIADWIEKNL